ncbi:MAG: methylmalonyl-CoA mutase family protein [Theionarchaea archaeon]|nr:methylmalonyl-CoA mutase family protein [Theionarchaea archaeon]MBU7039015.1 methylmalonyl-CoA mutase family protein [Theionarchaea archaeon]
MTSIKELKQKWEAQELKERQKSFATISGISLSRMYTPADVEIDYSEDLGFPGEYPFTRGVYPTMYRGRLWTMRQYAGFAAAEESNRRYRYLLSQGQTGLSVAFDLPTQIGYDSDDSFAEGEIGKTGVAIDTLRDVEILFDQIPLNKVSTSMTINSPAAILLAMYIVLAEKQNVPVDQISGTIQNDILKEYIARGTYIFPPGPSMRIITDIFEYCSHHVPRFNTISISGYHIREAGSTAAQEVAFTLANAIAYVEAALSKGLDVDTFAPRLSFFFNAHIDLFEEIAKFRAARRLWATIMKERFHAADPRSMMLRFHTQTAGCSLTAQQPENNIVRTTLEALAAVLGGTQSLHTNSMDEALALPSEKAVRIALRTQQILAHESGVTNTIDPLAGSYFIETMTFEIEEQARDYIKKIDSMGGVLKAIETGYIQREIQESSYRYQKEVESKERTVVGLNDFAIDEPVTIDILKVDPEVGKRQIERLTETRKSRNSGEVKNALDALESIAHGDQNLIPPIVEATRHYASIGEICGVLREVFGEYKAPVVF